MIPVPAETEYEKLCIGLMDRVIKKKITWDEYNLEWAYLMVLCVETIHPEIRPTRPPEMEGYETLKPQSKIDVGNDPSVRMYFQQLSRYENTNKTRVEWLKEAMRYIPRGDTLAHGKLTEKINEFEGRLYHFGPRIEAA